MKSHLEILRANWLAFVILLTLLCGAGWIAQAQYGINDGSDDRPAYYKAIGVSLWPYEMHKTRRSGLGRAWIDIWSNGHGSTINGKRSECENLDILLWVSIPANRLTVSDEAGKVLLEQNYSELRRPNDVCGESDVTVHKGHYLIRSMGIPPKSTKFLQVTLTDTAENQFTYSRSMDSLQPEIDNTRRWLTTEKH